MKKFGFLVACIICLCGTASKAHTTVAIDKLTSDPLAVITLGHLASSPEASRLAEAIAIYCLRFGYTSTLYTSTDAIEGIDSTTRIVVIAAGQVNLDSLESALLHSGAAGAYIFYAGEVDKGFSTGDVNAVTDWFCVNDHVVTIALPFVSAATMLLSDAGRPKDLRLELKRQGGAIRFATIHE